MTKFFPILAALVGSACLSSLALAQNAAHERHFGDGESGAAAGTALHNALFPNRPLPNSGGSVVPDTVRNMGAGQSFKDAFSNASKSNAGLSD